MKNWGGKHLPKWRQIIIYWSREYLNWTRDRWIWGAKTLWYAINEVRSAAPGFNRLTLNRMSWIYVSSSQRQWWFLYFLGPIFEQNFFLAAKTIEGHGMKIIAFKAKTMVIRLVNCVWRTNKVSMVNSSNFSDGYCIFGHIFVQKVFVAGKTVECRGMEIIPFN